MTYQEILTAVNVILQNSANASKEFSKKYAHVLEHDGKCAIPIDSLREIDYALHENALMLNTLLKQLIKSKGVANTGPLPRGSKSNLWPGS